MIADHGIPSCESAKLSFPPYSVALQDLLSHAWRNIYKGVYSNAQKRRFVLVVRWQEQEQCLSAQFQRRLFLKGRVQAIVSSLFTVSSGEDEAGVGGNGDVMRTSPAGVVTGGNEIWILFTISSSLTVL
jgi:hypothetical protein